MDVLVAGGSGFVGRSLCRVLDERGHDVTAASRSPDASALPDGVGTAVLDVTRAELDETVGGRDAVVNLVALPAHVQPRGRSHEAVHLGGTRHLVAASERTGVERFVQMSALGVDSDVDAAYFRTKRDAERAVRESSLECVVYRPSVVFGDGCAFVPFLERSVPPVVVPLPDGGRSKLQPMWVGDLAPMVADGVVGDRHAGSVYRLGGPEVLTLAETVQQVVGRRTVVPVPDPLAAIGAGAAEAVPGLPLGRDQYRVLDHDNVAEPNDVSAFGVDPGELTTLREYVDGR
jgi:NADH dehydrogenase